MLKIDDFTIDKIVVELRFQNSYLIWDVHGKIWTDFQEDKGEVLNLKDASPNKSVFQLGERYEISAEINRVTLADFRAKSLSDVEEFGRITEKFWKICHQHLDIQTIDRIGTRFFFVKSYESLKEASNALLATGLLNAPNKAVFGVKSTAPEKLDYIVRMQDETKGFSFRMHAEERTTNVNALPQVPEFESISKSEKLLVLDVDCYNTTPMRSSQLILMNWVTEWHHVIRRDFSKVIEGARNG